MTRQVGPSALCALNMLFLQCALNSLMSSDDDGMHSGTSPNVPNEL